ncbi:MAG: IGHMBP2 family helicase, partial [Bacteroidetes bacterium]
EKIVLTPLHERQKKGWCWYPIHIKHIEISTGETYQISLENLKPTDQYSAFQVGNSVSLFLNSQQKHDDKHQISGVIAYLFKNEMRISFNIDDLPDWIDESPLGVDLLYDGASLKEMENILQLVPKAKNDRLEELTEILLGQKKANFHTQIPDYYHLSSLNESQNEAIKLVLSAQDVAIIHGPPGTGKTTTLVDAIKLTLQNEKQVLVTAPSNTAVDVLTERLLAKGLKVLRIGHPARIDEALMDSSLDGQIAMHPDYRSVRKLRKQGEEFQKMAMKYKRKFGQAEREQRFLLLKEAKQVKRDAENLEKYIVESLLNQAQVITATLVGSVNKFIRFRKFSTVFIDEAAQALEPATWIPISKAERVIFAGDHCQLPPTVKNFEAAKQGLEKTLFEKLMPEKSISQMLKTQYRMNETIMEFSNRQFYHGELKADESVKNHCLLENDEILSLPFEFIDTAGCGFEEQTNSETKSRSNPEEAEILSKHLLNLLVYIQNISPELFTDSFSIGIISPYKAQVEVLRNLLYADADISQYKKWLDIQSIDGFQGQERNIIYISLVRSNENAEIGFLQDTRRLNVALTRAKQKLIVVGDSATLAGHKFYDDFLDYVTEKNAHKTAWELM